MPGCKIRESKINKVQIYLLCIYNQLLFQTSKCFKGEKWYDSRTQTGRGSKAYFWKFCYANLKTN